MAKVLYERDGRIVRITLNRPEVMNAIDDDLPVELAACIAQANADDGVHVIVLAGAGEAFCAGYDLAYYAQARGGAGNSITQDMPWDPMKDYAFMMRNTELFMSIWRSHRPVICKVHGYAVAGGSDIALCAARRGRRLAFAFSQFMIVDNRRRRDVIRWRISLSANRCPPRVKSGAGFRRDMR